MRANADRNYPAYPIRRAFREYDLGVVGSGSSSVAQRRTTATDRLPTYPGTYSIPGAHKSSFMRTTNDFNF
jgi:hypothetical protein